MLNIIKTKKIAKEFLIICLLLIFSFPAVKSLFIPGGFTSHDLIHHVIRQISMDKLLAEGQFPPRWSGELNNGYGYPVFLFNYPLPAMAGEVFHLLGLGYVDSVKAVLLFSMLISIVGMYLFLRSLLGSSLAAFLGAIFYLYAPIRFLNVYVAASVGSALALGILPFVFWSLVEIKNGKKWATWVGALSLAGLILAHNVTALIAAPLILAFAWVILRFRSGQVRGMFVLGLGLSAWFWLPAIVEKQYIIFDQIYAGFFKDQFVSFWQLLRSPWGYGLSHPQNPEPGDMSYQLGLIHIGVMLVYSSWFIFHGRKSKDRSLGLFILPSFIISIFLMLKISETLWDNLPFLSLVQFPLRFSSVAVFVSAIAAALLIKHLSFKKIVFVLLIILVIYANRNHWKINEVFDPGESYYLQQKPTTTSFNEHLPKWGRAISEVASSKYQALGGEGKIQIIEDKSHRVAAEIVAGTPITLRLNQFYFPGWEVKVDGQKQDFNYLSDGQSYGLIVFDMTSGKHTVLAEFKNTPIRNLADFISMISVILWIGFLCKLLMPNLFQKKKSS